MKRPELEVLETLRRTAQSIRRGERVDLVPFAAQEEARFTKRIEQLARKRKNEKAVAA